MKPSNLRIILTALFIPLMMTSACASPTTRLSGADKGGQVEVKAGELIVIQLDGNPSTGYTWEAKDLDANLFQLVGEPEFNSSNPGMPGAGGTQTLTFKALKPGSGTLTLIYHRPWEKDVEPLEIYSVEVNIK